MNLTAPQKPLIADKMTSTFWWEMLLDATWTGPNGEFNQVPKITGYSAFQGHDEAKDKRQMLMRKIVMLYTNGYLSRATKILFYNRVGEFVNKQQDTLMFTLSRTGPEFHDARYLKDFELNKFLNDFYAMIRQGKDVKKLLPATRATHSKDEYLNIDLQHAKIGSDELKLSNYCTRLIRFGHPFGAVTNFYNNYKEKFIN